MASSPGFVSRRVLLIGLTIGMACGASIVLAVLGFWWWWCSLLGVGLMSVTHLASERGRLLDPWSWMRGLDGEARVSAELRQLERHGYHLFEPVDLTCGDVDHVVIGPTGVFALETKNWPGQIRRDGDALKRDGWDASAALRQAVRNAMAIKDLTGVRWVDAVVVCVSSDLSEDPIRFGKVTVTSAAGVADVVTARPRVLDAERVEELVSRMSQRRG